jgi:hypothetical protein
MCVQSWAKLTNALEARNLRSGKKKYELAAEIASAGERNARGKS